MIQAQLTVWVGDPGYLDCLYSSVRLCKIGNVHDGRGTEDVKSGGFESGEVLVLKTAVWFLSAQAKDQLGQCDEVLDQGLYPLPLDGEPSDVDHQRLQLRCNVGPKDETANLLQFHDGSGILRVEVAGMVDTVGETAEGTGGE